MVTFGPALVKVGLATDVHQVQLVNQTMPFQQTEGAIDSYPVNARVLLLGFAENLAGIQVLFCGFNDAKDCPPLARQSNATGCQFSQQVAWRLGFRQGHGISSAIGLQAGNCSSAAFYGHLTDKLPAIASNSAGALSHCCNSVATKFAFLP
jgi:hypothetical protein